ncbi:MAG: hypothetical protein Kow0010_17630 [Dehalococcoidia bacterium]
MAATRQWLLAILDIAPDAIITTDATGRVLSFNRGAEHMFGYRSAEVIGRPVEFLIPQRFREAHAQDVVRFARGGVASRYMSHRDPVFGLRKDGTEFPAEASIARVDQPGGTILAVIVRDITARLETEQRLRQSEERARALFEEAVDAIAVIDQHGVVVDANAAASAVLGYAPGEIVGREFVDFLPAGVRAQAQAGFLAVRAGQAGDADLELLGNGRRVPAHVRANALSDGRVLVIFRDVSERLETERALRESEELFRSTFNDAPTGISVMDRQCNRIWVNQALCEMLGYERDELIGNNWLVVTHPDDLEAELRLTAELKRGERRYYQMEKRYVRKDGSVLWALMSGTALRDERGTITRYVAHVQDITERKRAEEALRESEERLRSLINEAPIVLLRLDEHGVITFCEGRCLDLLGIAPREVVGRSAWSIALAWPDGVNWLQAVYAGRSVSETIDVGHRAFQMRLTPVIHEGRITGVTGILFDSTERRELEQRLHRSQRLEAIGQLAGGIAHDFNNLLTVINGYADLALHALPEDSPLRADLQEVRNAGERASVLTRQLLAFSRREAARPTLVDLNDIVRNIEAMLQRLLGATIDLVAALDAAPATVLADEGQLEQVIMNLAINARDAMPEGGRLIIETHAGDEIILRVTDTGVGMTPDVQEHIFDPFFTTKHQGTGLGLATVHTVVTQAGGSIEVESAPGRGTTFTIHLPRSEAPAPAEATAEDEATPAPQSATVLVIEPDEHVREFVAGVLRREGYGVLTVPGGKEAVEAIQRAGDRVDLAICGLALPGDSGVDLGERLRTRQRRLRMLFMAGDAERHSSNPERLEVISKPFTADRLVRRVREVLARPAPAP